MIFWSINFFLGVNRIFEVYLEVELSENWLELKKKENWKKRNKETN